MTCAESVLDFWAELVPDPRGGFSHGDPLFVEPVRTCFDGHPAVYAVCNKEWGRQLKYG